MHETAWDGEAEELTIVPLRGFPEMTPEHSIVEELLRVVDATKLRQGDVLAITSKIVSKVEDRYSPASERDRAIAAETTRIVAAIPGAGGAAIVESRLGIIAAAAGVDASNIAGDRILLLPIDPDESARRIAAEIQERTGLDLGVIITDTVGRPWRLGQTDIAIGCANFRVFDDARGSVDTDGKPLSVTQRCIADEIAGATDLVKGKAAAIPIALVRGMGEYVVPGCSDRARDIIRNRDQDLFSLGTAEAFAQGKAARANPVNTDDVA